MRLERLYLLGLDDHPGNADLRDAMVTLYIQTQRWEQASEWNQAMRRDFPGRSELLERQAWIQQETRVREATALFTKQSLPVRWYVSCALIEPKPSMTQIQTSLRS